jgi:cobalt-zinc-cadmium resistance protein CzcA
MINRIITFSVRNKFIVGLFIIALIGIGSFSLSKLPIDAIPDITNNQVQIISLAPSLAVQEVESFITAPIEIAVANIPDIIELRSISRLGLSVITVVFEDATDVYWARQQLTERIEEAEESIPPGLAQISLALLWAYLFHAYGRDTVTAVFYGVLYVFAPVWIVHWLVSRASKHRPSEERIPEPA